MSCEVFNSSGIREGQGGLAQLEICVATRIANPKRRRLLQTLCLNTVVMIEAGVARMTYEQVADKMNELQPERESSIIAG